MQRNAFYAFLVSDLLAERDQGKEGHLEVLDAERDSHNRDAAEKAERHMNRGDFYSADQYPDHIHQYEEATAVVIARPDVSSERPQGELRHLHELDSERNAHNRDAEDKSYDEVVEADQKAAQNKP